jgi:hypothetical protein
MTHTAFLLSNADPVVDVLDEGIIRRVRLIKFSSKFCSNPDEDEDLEFKAIEGMEDSMNAWRSAFLYMLCQRVMVNFKKYQIFGKFEYCKAVEDSTKEYERELNIQTQCISQCFVKASSETLTSKTDIARRIRAWVQDNAELSVDSIYAKLNLVYDLSTSRKSYIGLAIIESNSDEFSTDIQLSADDVFRKAFHLHFEITTDATDIIKSSYIPTWAKSMQKTHIPGLKVLTAQIIRPLLIEMGLEQKQIASMGSSNCWLKLKIRTTTECVKEQPLTEPIEKVLGKRPYYEFNELNYEGEDIE